jgi:nucleotide-binding universal stress UspA family protein
MENKKMLRNILLPTDGSTAALLAAETLADLVAAPSETTVTVAIVIEQLSVDSTDYDDEVVGRHNEKMRERAQSALDATCRVLGRKGISHAQKIVEGDPVSVALAHEIENGQYDAIAMGSRGLGMQKNNLHYLGSVTEHVIRRVDIPVIVIPVHKDK